MAEKDSPSAFINCSETQQFCSKLFAIISVSSACLPLLPFLSPSPSPLYLAALPLRPQQRSAAHPLLPFGFVVIYFLLLGASRRASSCLVCSPAATMCVCVCSSLRCPLFCAVCLAHPSHPSPSSSPRLAAIFWHVLFQFAVYCPCCFSGSPLLSPSALLASPVRLHLCLVLCCILLSCVWQLTVARLLSIKVMSINMTFTRRERRSHPFAPAPPSSIAGNSWASLGSLVFCLLSVGVRYRYP